MPILTLTLHPALVVADVWTFCQPLLLRPQLLFTLLSILLLPLLASGTIVLTTVRILVLSHRCYYCLYYSTILFLNY